MSRVVRRHPLKGRDTRLFLVELRRVLGLDPEQLLGTKPRVELLKTKGYEVFIVKDKALLMRIEDVGLLPTLLFEEYLSLLPKVVVDMGAIPHICNGADVMAPGILCVEGEFSKDSLILIVDERYGRPLAIGRALTDSETMKSTKHGKVVKNLHHVGDKIWNIIKKI